MGRRRSRKASCKFFPHENTKGKEASLKLHADGSFYRVECSLKTIFCRTGPRLACFGSLLKAKLVETYLFRDFRHTMRLHMHRNLQVFFSPSETRQKKRQYSSYVITMNNSSSLPIAEDMFPLLWCNPVSMEHSNMCKKHIVMLLLLLLCPHCNSFPTPAY